MTRQQTRFETEVHRPMSNYAVCPDCEADLSRYQTYRCPECGINLVDDESENAGRSIR